MWKKMIADAPEVKIVVAIATFNSGTYIYESLKRYKKEIDLFPSSWSVELSIGLNGTHDNGHAESEIARFQQDNPRLKLTLLKEPQADKNIAVNQLVRHAPAGSIIHFLDDDIALKPGSMRRNIETLQNSPHNKDVIVGSHFEPFVRTFSYYHQRENFYKALRSYFWYRVFSVSENSTAPKSQFCSAQSYCAFSQSMPIIPARSTGICDDSYVSRYFALLWKNSPAMGEYVPILKPTTSTILFESPVTLESWWKQQTRSFAGVYLANLFFGTENARFFSKYLPWEYDYIKEARLPIKATGMDRIFSYIHLWIKNILVRKGIKLLRSGKVPEWGVVESSKVFNESN